MGHKLDAATVFTCLALFNGLISPLNSFPWVINGLIDAFISTRRLSRFLCCCEYNPEPERTTDQPGFIPEDGAVLIYACSTWSSSDEESWNLVLNHVTLSLPKGSLVAVVGEVGSGKSSLLNSMLGEMRLIHGTVRCCGSIAYVAQVPWILSETIRENILFGKNYDSQRYSDTLTACALDADILQMVGGDMAYVGEKGANLSGGQRARLALARAIYHGSDIYILDDVLSAVDAQVGRWILQNAIMGPLMEHKTRILCTHNVQAISKCDMIVVMDKGYVKWVGNSADAADSVYSISSPLNDFNATSNVQDQECGTKAYTVSGQSILPSNDSVHALEEAQEIIEVEMRKEGKVELTV